MNLPARPIALLDPSAAADLMGRLRDNLSLAVRGKTDQARLTVTCAVAQGHLLLEDIPGVGKTTLAEAFARSVGLSFARIQFTADMLPADVVGTQVLQAQSGTFDFRPGPLFRQLVLADELNRAPPRTQSALLEAMAQGQVSVDGVTHLLPNPFLVIATQNPVDLTGTFPLPDSQLDRFLVRLSLGYPAADVEADILRTRGAGDPLRALSAVAGPDELAALQRSAAEVAVDAAVAEYAVRLLQETRRHPELERGASTRAALALMAAAKANALWEGRDFVVPEDVRALWAPVITHRVVLKPSLAGGSTTDEASHLLEEVARAVAVPR
ncbi:MAG TPA: AAA family ATPase [Myxococcaceae bacterium]|nr:AAA family ATPase [Myxococcaceae bacterium]